MDDLRFLDVLTTATALTNHLGASLTTAEHLLLAVDILRGTRTIESLGQQQSPLLRARRPEPGVDGALRELVQRWFERVGGRGDVVLAGDDLAQFLRDLESLGNTPGGG